MMVANSAFAIKLAGKGVQDAFKKLNFDAYPEEVVTRDNVLKMNAITFGICNGKERISRPKGNENFYWFRKSMSESTYILGVTSVTMEFKNLTDEPIAIKWGQSAIHLGNYYGVPFLGGMKYKDAGNPSMTPDTLIPPWGVQEVTLFHGNPKWTSSGWQDGYTYVRTDDTLNAEIIMKVESSSGSKYYNYKTPNMILPSYVVEKYRYVEEPEDNEDDDIR